MLYGHRECEGSQDAVFTFVKITMKYRKHMSRQIVMVPYVGGIQYRGKYRCFQEEGAT